MSDDFTIEVKSGNAEADKGFMDVFASTSGLSQTPTGFIVSPELVAEYGEGQVVAAIEAPLNQDA